jgi:hypothetical protein
MRNRSMIVLIAMTLIAAAHGAQAQDTRRLAPIIVAEGGAHSDPQAAPTTKAPADDAEENLSPEEKMRRRFPQPVRVGDLIGLPLLDRDDSTLGYVRHVVRTPEGKIQLIVNQGRLFGWGGRLVRCQSRLWPFWRGSSTFSTYRWRSFAALRSGRPPPPRMPASLASHRQERQPASARRGRPR